MGWPTRIHSLGALASETELVIWSVRYTVSMTRDGDRQVGWLLVGDYYRSTLSL